MADPRLPQEAANPRYHAPEEHVGAVTEGSEPQHTRDGPSPWQNPKHQSIAAREDDAEKDCSAE